MQIHKRKCMDMQTCAFNACVCDHVFRCTGISPACPCMHATNSDVGPRTLYFALHYTVYDEIINYVQIR